MTNPNTYDARVQAIRTSNQPILDAFRTWLKQSGLSEKPINNHVDNIDFFTHYLVYYDDPLKKLDEADGSDVWMFLTDWFPRKARWASPTSSKRNSLLSKRSTNEHGMPETGRVPPEPVAYGLKPLHKGGT